MTPFQQATLNDIRRERRQKTVAGRKEFGGDYQDTYYMSSGRWVPSIGSKTGWTGESIVEFAKREFGSGVIKKTSVIVGSILPDDPMLIRSLRSKIGQRVYEIQAYAICASEAEIAA